ncbi:NAD(P)-binding protein [Marasmius fiardii PR-910]|nr:NAD(P)-binding protein [Marasmius fiardii PR-910]
MSLLVLSSSDVERVTSTFSPQYLQLLMADVFALASRPAGSESTTAPLAYTPHRTPIPTEQHKALFMPARISTMGTTMKVVSAPTDPNDTRGLPASTIVLDKETGAVKAMINARSLTALRNAAGSVLSTKLIGPTNPIHVVAYGAGEQISAHLDLHLKAFPGIKSCTVVNRSLNSRVQGLLNKLQSNHPEVDITPLASCNPEDHSKIQNALSTASIIITATSSKNPLFPSNSVPTGAHVILIGSYRKEMKEIDKNLVMRAVSSKEPKSSLPRLLVDSVEACMQEAGELIDAGLSTEQMTEIGTLVLRARANNEGATPEEMRVILSSRMSVTEEPGSSFDGPVSLFKSVGIGLQDVAIAIAVVERAKEIQGGDGKGLGVLLEGYDKV